MEEHKRVIDICIAAAKGSGVPVIAGTGSNSTDEAIELTKHAKKAGADAAMLVVPYYNKPTQEGLFQHFKTVAEAVDIPILLYNVPPRTGGDMQVDTVMRLSQVKNIIGIKDASYDMARPRPSSRPRASCSSGRMPAPWASWPRAATAASR